MENVFSFCQSLKLCFFCVQNSFLHTFFASIQCYLSEIDYSNFSMIGFFRVFVVILSSKIYRSLKLSFLFFPSTLLGYTYTGQLLLSPISKILYLICVSEIKFLLSIHVITKPGNLTLSLNMLQAEKINLWYYRQKSLFVSENFASLLEMSFSFQFTYQMAFTSIYKVKQVHTWN